MEIFRRNEPVLVNRDHYSRPAPIPDLRLRDLTTRSSDMHKRDSSSNDSSNQTSNGSSTTPIVIGVVIPVLIIAIILLVIWKRRQKITKQEELNDHMKYKSLDFGIDDSQMREKKGRKAKPDVTISDIKGSLRKDRGLSLDLDASNPYLLPPEVHSSRESLHSLSRSITTGDDRYRPTTFIPDDGSLRSPSSLRDHGDGSSIFTASTRRHRTGTMDTDARTDYQARLPPKRDDSDPGSISKPLPVAEKPDNGLLAPNAHFDRNSTLSTGSKDGHVAAFRASNNYLGQYISGGQNETPKKEDQPGLMVSEMEVQPTPPADGTPREPPVALVHHEVTVSRRQSSIYDHGVAELADNDQSSRRSSRQDLPPPQIHTTSYEMDAAPRAQFPQRQKSLHKPDHFSKQSRRESGTQLPSVPEIQTPQQQHDTHDDAASDYYDEYNLEDYADYVDYTYRGSMVGVRPLPPDDPSENPEQRANRIRSFYKEYFEDGANPSKSRTSYYDGSEQYDDFDYGYYEQSHSRGPSIRSDGRQRAFSHGMRPHYPPGPRAYSSMSGRMGPQYRQPPKKKLPPPKPLMMLPTPSKLKDDDFLPNAIDYAPPQIFKNQRSGTPDSLRGGLRPYSPSVKPHNPVTSSFDDLAVMPSPHLLRKSGTFTGLDFAPPRRFKENGEAMSETGSIRSNGSNLSKMQLASIRNGAYRVSRIPKDVAGTRDDMFAALKPKWDMRGDGMGVAR